MRGVDFSYRYGDSYPCPTCGAMLDYNHANEHKCKGRIRQTTKCPDCGAMLEVGLESEHYRFCKKRIEREKTERREVSKKREQEKRDLGLVSYVKMISPKESMIFMEPEMFGDDGYLGNSYREVEVEKHPWKCRMCGNVWQTEHEARNCPFDTHITSIGGLIRQKPPHAKSYLKLYGVRYFENGQPRGNYLREIEFNVIRVESPEPLPEGKKWDTREHDDLEAAMDKQAKMVQDQERSRAKFELPTQADTVKGMTEQEIEESGLERIKRDVATMPVEAQKLVNKALGIPEPKVTVLIEPEQSPATQLEPGVYRNGSDIFVVKQTRDKTHVYAKKLVESTPRTTESGEQVTFDFEYARGAIYSLKPEMKMSLEEAKPYMIKYGRCIACGRHLKQSVSVERGIGPVCIKYFRSVA